MLTAFLLWRGCLAIPSHHGQVRAKDLSQLVDFAWYPECVCRHGKLTNGWQIVAVCACPLLNRYLTVYKNACAVCALWTSNCHFVEIPWSASSLSMCKDTYLTRCPFLSVWHWVCITVFLLSWPSSIAECPSFPYLAIEQGSHQPSHFVPALSSLNPHVLRYHYLLRIFIYPVSLLCLWLLHLTYSNSTHPSLVCWLLTILLSQKGKWKKKNVVISSYSLKGTVNLFCQRPVFSLGCFPTYA